VTGGTDPADGSVECGDGTDYPMLVTLDQLAEIMYRVRKAKITTGGFTANGLLQYYRPLSFDVPEFTHEHTVTAQIGSGEPPTASLSIIAYGDDNVEVIHGAPIPTSLDNELVEMGPPVTGSGRLSMEGKNNINHFESRYVVGPFIQTQISGTYFAIRETINEMALFSQLQGDDLFYPDCHSAFNLRCIGSTYDTSTSSLSYAYGVHLHSSAARSFIFREGSGGQSNTDTFLTEKINNVLYVANVVAYTGTSPTDPAGNLYLRLGFQTKVFSDDQFCGLIIDSGNKLVGYKGGSTALTLSLKLSGGQMVTCPLYAYVPDYQSNSNFVVITNTLTLSSEVGFVVEATEWWPYAKDSPAVPVWNSATGAKL
jgi:hypothetical protein